MAARISQVGLVARSPEGHAARGMAIKGHEELWVDIQAHTFRNWVNEHLRSVGMEIKDLVGDFADGTKLCALVEVLQKRQIGTWNKRPTNHHQYLENVTTALNAIAEDEIKLVNIGNVDIVNGNLKLILGLIWSLIVHYQIGRSKFPPKKLMLAWLKAVLPECKVHNFTTDWNSGQCLSALLDYCKPGLFPHWRNIDPNDRVYNCQRAMELARKEFEIPLLLEPEYLASPYLDELSGMTYLSYFMKENSPGYKATLRWVQNQIPDKRVTNFTTDWNDGRALCSLIKSLGGPVPGYKTLSSEYSHWESNLNLGIRGGEKLGIEPILKAKDMADKNVEHLGVMAYTAAFQWIPARASPGQRVKISCDKHTLRVNDTISFNVEFLDEDINIHEVKAEATGPHGRAEVKMNLSSHGGKGTFTSKHVGMHQITVTNEGERVSGAPVFVRVVPKASEIDFPGIDPCAIGSIVEVLVNSYGGSTSNVDVTAWSPTGRPLNCPVNAKDGVYTASFQPDEVGEWSIAVTHKGEHLQGGPFPCFVFDPNGIKLLNTDGAQPNTPFNFLVDASASGGLGDIQLDIVHDKRSVPFSIEKIAASLYKVSFVPRSAGKHRVFIYFNGMDVRGSPYTIRVGTRKRSSLKTSTVRDVLNSRSPIIPQSPSPPNIRPVSPLLDKSSPLYSPSVVKQANKQKHYRSSIGEEEDMNKSSVVFNNHGYDDSFHSNERSHIERERYATSQEHNKFSSSDRSNTVSFADRNETNRFVASDRNNSVSFKDRNESNRLVSSNNTVSFNDRIERKPLEPIITSDRKQMLENGYSSVKTSSFEKRESFQNRNVLSSENFKNELMSHVNRAKSPSMRVQSPKSPVFRTASPEVRSSVFRFDDDRVGSPGYKVSTSASTFRSSERVNSPHLLYASPLPMTDRRPSVDDGINSSSNIQVSKNYSSSHRRDSWDAINKTENLLSAESIDRHRSPSPYRAKSPSRILSPEPGLARGSAYGDSLRVVPINRQSSISLDLGPDVMPADVSVVVTSPTRKDVPARVARSIRNGELSAMFTATEVGEHSVDVRVRNQRIAGAPFRTHAYNLKAIRVGKIPNGKVGEPVQFEIDGSGAGSGNLEILVNGGHVTSFVRNLGQQRFLASFVPHEAVLHSVDIKFNGEVVSGSPWAVSVSGGGAMTVLGEAVKLVAAGTPAIFHLASPGFSKADFDVTVTGPSKRQLNSRVTEEKPGEFRVEFTPTDVGSHIVDVVIGGVKFVGGPLVAKAYNSSLIRVTDVANGVVGQPCQFKVDASQAGEGQLEISINEGQVPNHVQVVGGGRCLISFTPEIPKPHYINIKFNGETVHGCPFISNVSDSSRVSLSLHNLEVIPVNQVARFHMTVDDNSSAELAVSVRGPVGELPVKVTGNIDTGFVAEFVPRDVGGHTLTVEYNGQPVGGTPFVAKAYDARRVYVGPLPRGQVGKTLEFMVDASQAGEGNLEITISARGHNIPTQVHPQGNARFSVSFLPIEAVDHTVSINFNKESVPGSPFSANIQGDSPHNVVVSGSALNAAPVGKTSYFTMSNVAGGVEDIEVNVEGPNGQSVPAVVKEGSGGMRVVEFTPRIVGEHRMNVSYRKVAVAGSPFSCKVYDCSAIKVRNVEKGVVGRPVTFIVETSQAGPGNLEVTVDGGRVPTSAQAQGPHTYAISFTPREAIVHTIDLRFNSEHLPGSPFKCVVSETARVMLPAEGMEKVSVGRATSFVVAADSSLGSLAVQVLSPARKQLPVELIPVMGNKTQASFTPDDVGDHSVEVTIGGNPVEGSPFLVKAYDASKVKVADISSGVVGKPVFFSINASQAGAGNLEIIVSVNGRNVPNYVQSEGNARFRVNFKPQEAASHSLSVRFNGEPVPGSPFTCKVLGSNQVVVSGPAMKMTPIGQPTSLIVDPQSVGGTAQCQVSIQAPSGKILPVTLNKMDAKYIAQFTPSEVGRHNVDVILDKTLVKGSPFACNVYDVRRIKITGLGPAKVHVGKPTTFRVDACEAGEGTLELVVSTERSTVKAEVVACARGLYDVTFVPHESVSHYVNISFNEEDVPGSPFRCDVLDSGNKARSPGAKRDERGISVKGEGPHEVVIGQKAFYDVDVIGATGHVDMEVLGPDGSSVHCRVQRINNVKHRAAFTPMSAGLHHITVFHNEQPVNKQPFSVGVYNPAAVHILDLEEGFTNRAVTFKVDSSEAGPGNLSITIRAAGSQVKYTQRTLTEGLHEVTFHPTIAVPHKIDVKYNGLHIDGCPMELAVKNPAVGQDVMATGVGLYQANVGKPTSFVIETLGHPTKDFDVLITGPNSTAVPVRCYQQKDGNLLAEFTAQYSGAYKIEVSQGSRAVRGSPYICQVYDASKVKIVDIKKPISLNMPTSVKLQRKGAGFAELDVAVTSPLGQDLPIQVRSGPDKESDIIEFTPTLPGNYQFRITYGGDEIPGSPLLLTCEDSGPVKATGDGLSGGQVDSTVTFQVQADAAPTVRIDGPDTSPNPNVEHVEPGLYNVTYVPREVGVFDSQVFVNDREILGSPFHPRIVDVRKIRAIGGWESLCDSQGRLDLSVNTTKKISLDIAEAGPGNITAECRGPDGESVPVAVEPQSPSRVRVLLTPRDPGEYLLTLYYSGVQLPNSPIKGHAEGSTSGPVRVILMGRGLANAKCHQEAEFTIDGSQAGPGAPEVTLTNNKQDVKVSLDTMGNSIYRASYTPAYPGTYLLNVMWADKQVKGCPLKVNVVASADASQVTCSGEGLRMGTVGKEIRSFIDTRRAGPGELTAHCVGPHKVAYCELYDHSDGTFTLNVKPQESGRHILTVKYGGEHVPGSPFALRVAGAPDASKVRVYGPGIEHGVLATFQSRFICDTRGAGAGQLTVRVRGPKGAFRVEMQRESQKDRTILCKFHPTEPGDYRVEIKWAGELVPGSPFAVMIFDTQEELTRFLQGQTSPGSEVYGSVGYGHTLPPLPSGRSPSWRGSQPTL